MAELRFIVEHQRLAPAHDCDFIVAARSVNYLHAGFQFLTDDWTEATTGRNAVFRREDSDETITVALNANNEALVPTKMLKTEGMLLVSVYGGSSPFITTTEQRILIREAGFTE